MANKQDLIAKVAEATELTKKDSAVAVDAVFSAIESFLSEGEKVQLIGFGNQNRARSCLPYESRSSRQSGESSSWNG